MSVFRSIIRYEGIIGLYQGWVPAVIGSSVSWGGYFYFYERLKRSMVDYKTNTNNSSVPMTQVLNSFDHFVLACSAGGIMVAITNPIWLIKTRMQLQMKKTGELYNIKPYNGMVDAASRIIKEEGYLALYKGSGPAMLLTSHGGVQFVVYEYLRKHFHYTRAQRGVYQRAGSVWHRFELSLGYLLMGAVAKITASTVTYPLQVIKARMQQRSDALELTGDGEVRAVTRQYRGLTDSYKRIIKHEGAYGLFKGLIPNAIRVAPGAAITFVVYESVLDLLSP
jgi:solute carrier family 25 folate transporter 32